MATINEIDPSTPDPNDVAGQGDDELRAFKQVIFDSFPQAPIATPADPWDIVLAVGPRAINDVVNKATNADLAALDVRVGVNELAVADHEIRITANEGDIATLQAIPEAWPIGSIFISGDGGTPNSKGILGTWVAVGDGRFLLGAASGFGGTANPTNPTLVAANLPQHKHKYASFREDAATTGNIPSVYTTSPATTYSSIKAGRDQSSTQYSEFNTDLGIGLSGSPTAISIDPPASLTVRFFQRTA